MGVENDPVVIPGGPTTEPTARILITKGQRPPQDDPVVSYPGIGNVVEGGDPNAIVDQPLALDQAANQQATGNAGLGFLQGSTFGMYPRIAGGLEVLAGTAPDYNAGLQKHLEYLQRAQTENPGSYFLGELAGGATTGALTGTAIPRAAVALGAGRTLRNVIGGATDVATGTAQGAGTTYSGNPEDYINQGALGFAMGGLFGVPARILGQAGGGLVGNFATDLPPSLVRAGRIADPDVNRLLSHMYPRSMLTDAGPAMEAQTKAAVLGTGPNAMGLRADLTARNNTVNQTLAGQAEQSFGAPLASPRIVQDQLDTNIRPQISRLYSQAFANPQVQPVDVTRVAAYLDQAILDSTDTTLLGTLRRARAALDDPMTGTLTADPERLHSARSTINRILRETDANGKPLLTDPNTRRLLDNTSQRMTDELNIKVPGIKQIDSMRAELGAQRDALDFNSPGARIYNKPGKSYVSPEEMDRILTEAAAPKGTNVSTAEPMRLQQSANFQLHSKLASKNRLTAAEDLFGKDEPHPANVEKTEQVFGRQPTADFIAAKERERAQRDLYTNAVGNSQTASRLAVADENAKRNAGAEAVANFLTGRLMALARNASDYISRSRGNRANEQIAAMLRANTPQGIAENQAILMQAVRDRATRQQQARYLLQSRVQGAASAGAIPKQLELRD